MDAGKGDILRRALTGGVMTERRIDQILRHPGSTRLYESCAISAAHGLRLFAQSSAGS